jgi:hypothetical protein
MRAFDFSMCGSLFDMLSKFTVPSSKGLRALMLSTFHEPVYHHEKTVHLGSRSNRPQAHRKEGQSCQLMLTLLRRSRNRHVASERQPLSEIENYPVWG